MAKIRSKVITALIGRYRQATLQERGKILDEFVMLTGYHRKHAARMLRGDKKKIRETPRVVCHHGKYTDAVRQTLEAAWLAADRVCSKRLKIIMPTLLDDQISNGQPIDELMRLKLMAMSAATIDRALARARVEAARHTTDVRSTAERGDSSVQGVDAPWDMRPGSMDLRRIVRNWSRHRLSTQVLLLTDRATNWSSMALVPVRHFDEIEYTIHSLQLFLPFPLLEIITSDLDVYQNKGLRKYCHEAGILLKLGHLMAKPSKKMLRHITSAISERSIKNEAYQKHFQNIEDLLRSIVDYHNYFAYGSAERSKIEATRCRSEHSLVPPYSRLLLHPQTTLNNRESLMKIRARLSPKALRTTRRLQGSVVSQPEYSRSPSLGLIVDQSDGLLGQHSAVDLARTCQETPCTRSSRRSDPFATVADQLLLWFRTEPHVSAAELLARLQVQHPGQFKPGQVRTLQRRVKVWRDQTPT